MRSTATATSNSSGWASVGSLSVSSAGETMSFRRASGRAYQECAASPTSGQSRLSHAPGSTTQAVRRFGCRPMGAAPARRATSSPQAPAALTRTGAA